MIEFLNLELKFDMDELEMIGEFDVTRKDNEDNSCSSTTSQS